MKWLKHILETQLEEKSNTTQVPLRMGWEGGGSSETIHYTRFAAQSEAFFQPLGVNPNLQIGYVCIFILALY